MAEMGLRLMFTKEMESKRRTKTMMEVTISERLRKLVSVLKRARGAKEMKSTIRTNGLNVKYFSNCTLKLDMRKRRKKAWMVAMSC